MPEEQKKAYGGMAVVEGVMMRSPQHYSVACRLPNGNVFVHTEHIEKTWIGRQKWLNRPFLRGTLAMLDTMGLGMRAMRIASDVQLDPKYQPESDGPHPHEEAAAKGESSARKDFAVFLALAVGVFGAHRFYLGHLRRGMFTLAAALSFAVLGLMEAPLVTLVGAIVLGLLALVDAAGILGDALLDSDGRLLRARFRWQPYYEAHQKTIDNLILLLSIIFSLGFGFLLFNATPQFIAEYVVRLFSGGGEVAAKNEHLTGTNYLAEVVKLAFFIGYVSLIRLYPAIMDVFRYHGAEHQAINAMEAGEDLTPDNCLQQTRLHPRCGTNFAIIVFIVSFLLFPFIPRDLVVPATSPGWMIALTRLPVELFCLPIVAGISYEVIRLAGKSKNETWVKVFLWPGLQTQLITTAVPEAKHAEVAIAALEAARHAEETGELLNVDDYRQGALSDHAADEPGRPDDQVDTGGSEAGLPHEV